MRLAILFHALYILAGSATADAQTVPARLQGYVFDIAPEVPAGDLAVIFDGMIRAEDYFARNFGLTLSAAQKRKWRIKVVADGRGNTERGGGGSCCTAFSITHKPGPRLFFDVAHRHWRERDRTRNLATVGHEYTHGIQNVFGVHDFWGGPMGDWMEEGMAEFYAWEMAVWKRKIRRSQAERAGFRWARDNGAIRFSLKQLEPDGGHPHPGGIGQVAVAGLVALSPEGAAAPLIYMQQLRRGNRRRAFETAFGLSLRDFYARFEAWRQKAAAGQPVDPVWSR